MADVLDVAEYILRQKGAMDTFRLQKLAFYAQAYHTAKHGSPLISDRIEAWTNGPAIPRLYQHHRGSYQVSTVGGDPTHLDREETASIAMTLRLYGDHDSNWLVRQTHMENPWLEARKGLGPKDRGSQPISLESIQDYYTPIFNDQEVEEALDASDGDWGMTPEELRARFQA